MNLVSLLFALLYVALNPTDNFTAWQTLAALSKQQFIF